MSRATREILGGALAAVVFFIVLYSFSLIGAINV